jgi:hypothetical protein
MPRETHDFAEPWLEISPRGNEAVDRSQNLMLVDLALLYLLLVAEIRQRGWCVEVCQNVCRLKRRQSRAHVLQLIFFLLEEIVIELRRTPLIHDTLLVLLQLGECEFRIVTAQKRSRLCLTMTERLRRCGTTRLRGATAVRLLWREPDRRPTASSRQCDKDRPTRETRSPFVPRGTAPSRRRFRGQPVLLCSP